MRGRSGDSEYETTEKENKETELLASPLEQNYHVYAGQKHSTVPLQYIAKEHYFLHITEGLSLQIGINNLFQEQATLTFFTCF